MAAITNAAISRAENRSATSAIDIGMLVLRGTLGLIFFAHGAQKLLGWFGGKGLFTTIISFHDNLGISPFLAYVAIFTEFFGGIALMLGVLSRLSALGIAVTMLVAIFKVRLKGGFFMETKGIEYNLALLAMAICAALIGPGMIALASKVKRLPFFLH